MGLRPGFIGIEYGVFAVNLLLGTLSTVLVYFIMNINKWCR